MKGNCLSWAVGMYLAGGCLGRIEPEIVWAGKVPKLRFYYVTPDGVRLHFYPRHPKKGLHACIHACWFTGVVKRES